MCVCFYIMSYFLWCISEFCLDVLLCDITRVSFSSFFFVKQKTAYEMRISDWSSDVCSSDLGIKPIKRRRNGEASSGRRTRSKLDGLSVLRALRAHARLHVRHGRPYPHLRPCRTDQGGIRPERRWAGVADGPGLDRKSTRLNSSH